MPLSTRILLVDDHALLRGALRALLASEAGLEVVGEAESGPDAVRLAAGCAPDVIVMDVEMPGAFDGVEATRQILAAAVGGPPIVIAMSSASRHEAAMRAAGATAFLPKTQATQLPDVIRTARTAPA